MRKIFISTIIFLLSCSLNVSASMVASGSRYFLKLTSTNSVEYDKILNNEKLSQKGTVNVSLKQIMRYKNHMVGWYNQYYIKITRGEEKLDEKIGKDIFFSNYIFPEIEIYKQGVLLEKVTFKKAIEVKSYFSTFIIPIKAAKAMQNADDIYIIMPMTDKKTTQRIKIPKDILDEWLKVLNKKNIETLELNTYKERKRSYDYQKNVTDEDFIKVRK